MVGFVESPRFPESISFGSAGGPTYNTAISRSKSGRVITNENWAYPLHRYNVQHAIKKQSQVEQLLAFFHVVGGMGKGFRYKDWIDFKSCPVNSTPTHNDMVIGTGNGSLTSFQMTKTYVWGSYNRVRLIKKPVSGTILVGKAGVLQSSGFTVDYTTGIITFTVAPTAGQSISWGGEFDVPCQFGTDDFVASVEDYDNINMELIINEIRI